MNLKLMAVLLCCICFVNAHAINKVEYKKIQYADVATQLIVAETLDDAKNILGQYNPKDQVDLCNYLLEQQRRWCIEHDLFDHVSLTCDSRELLKCVCATIGMTTLHFFSFIKYVCLRHNSMFFKGARLGVSPALMCLFYRLIAWAGNNKDLLLEEQIHTFKRIEELSSK